MYRKRTRRGWANALAQYGTQYTGGQTDGRAQTLHPYGPRCVRPALSRRENHPGAPAPRLV